MRIFRHSILALLAVVLLQNAALAGHVFKVVIDSDWVYPQREDVRQTHEFDISAQLLQGTDWTLQNALEHIKKSHFIFQQCGVTLRKIHLTLSTVHADLTIADFGSEGRDRKLVKALPPAVRPAIYFVQDIAWLPSAPLPARIAVSPAYAYYSKLGISQDFVDVTFVSSRIRDPLHMEQRREGYDTVAHELGHILMNDGHVRQPMGNLMSDDVEGGSGEISESQCEAIRRHPRVRLRPTSR